MLTDITVALYKEPEESVYSQFWVSVDTPIALPQLVIEGFILGPNSSRVGIKFWYGLVTSPHQRIGRYQEPSRLKKKRVLLIIIHLKLHKPMNLLRYTKRLFSVKLQTPPKRKFPMNCSLKFDGQHSKSQVLEKPWTIITVGEMLNVPPSSSIWCTAPVIA